RRKRGTDQRQRHQGEQEVRDDDERVPVVSAPGRHWQRSLPYDKRAAGVDAMRLVLKPVQRWVWGDPARRGQRLLRFAEVEADGGRDLVRAAELTPDARLRRLYLRHASDERRHADIFRERALELLRAHPPGDGAPGQWIAPGERGLDDVE